MGTKTRVVLLCCGSFNPVTNMHLRMFELARDYLNQAGHFQVIGGIISPVNDAYGKTELISAKHRCEMVDLALSTSDWIRLDCWESDQEKWLTTVKVLTHHQNFLDSITNANDQTDSVPKKQKLDRENINCSPLNDSNVSYWDLTKPAKLMLLCGADLLESFGSPGLWADEDIIHIVGRHGLVVISRQGSNPQQFVYESDLLSRYQHNIHNVTEWIPNEVSATRIRRAVRRGESVRYLVPDPVLQYIKDHDLYRTNNKYFDFTSTHTSPVQFYDHSFLHGNHGDKVGDMFIENEQETAV